MGLRTFPGKFSVCVCEVWWQSVQRCRNSITKPVRTCPQYSDHVRSLRNAFFCTFECSYSSALRSILLKLHTLTRLIESFPTVCGLWSCIEIEMSIPLYRSLETVDRKSFEHRNFLVLRPVRLKIAYFKSAN